MHTCLLTAILLNLCRITTDIPKVLRKHNGSIEERFQIYRQKSQTITSAEDFKSWLAEKDATIEAKHNLARHLREYAHLHESCVLEPCTLRLPYRPKLTVYVRVQTQNMQRK